MCPGNEESAGKRRKRSITPGNRWLKRTLVQAAWGASHTQNTDLASQYRRMAGRRGKKRALIAVGHSILVIFYYLWQRRTTDTDLGVTSLIAWSRSASLGIRSSAWKVSATKSR